MLCIMISIFFFTNDAIAMENEIKEDDSGNYDDQKDVEPNIFTLKKPLLGNIVDFANDIMSNLRLLMKRRCPISNLSLRNSAEDKLSQL